MVRAMELDELGDFLARGSEFVFRKTMAIDFPVVPRRPCSAVRLLARAFQQIVNLPQFMAKLWVPSLHLVGIGP